MKMLEKEIEKYLVREVKKRKGITYKFVSPGNAGVPDRIVILKGNLFFIELKAPGEKPRAIQELQIKKLEGHKQTVYVADSKERIDEIMDKF